MAESENTVLTPANSVGDVEPPLDKPTGTSDGGQFVLPVRQDADVTQGMTGAGGSPETVLEVKPDAEPEPDSKPERVKSPGRVTSVLGVVLLAAMFAVAVTPFLAPSASLGRAVVNVVAGFVAAMVLLVPTVALGLRSASKPKGTRGRGRGIATVVLAAVVPVAMFSVMSASAYGYAHRIMHSGLVAKSDGAEEDGVALVSPVGKVELTAGETQALEVLDLMPESVIEDGESVTFTTDGGVLSADGEAVDLDDGTVGAISQGIEEAKKRGYEVSMGSDGRIHGVDDEGNEVVVGITEDGINIQTDTDLTMDDLVGYGRELLSSGLLGR